MSDLAVKLFMVDNDLHEFESAQAIMLRYGLAQTYEDTAAKLECLGVTADNAGEDIFADGATFIGDVVDSIRFAVQGQPSDYSETEHAFLRGVNTAVEKIREVVATAVRSAQGDAEQPDLTPASEGLEEALLRAIFGEQTAR